MRNGTLSGSTIFEQKSVRGIRLCCSMGYPLVLRCSILAVGRECRQRRRLPDASG